MLAVSFTDPSFWITTCAMSLQQAGARCSNADAEQTAMDLYEDPQYGQLQPTAAVAAFLRSRQEAA